MNEELSLPSGNDAGNVDDTSAGTQAGQENQSYDQILNRFNHTHGELRNVKSELAQRNKEIEDLKRKTEEAHSFINRFQPQVQPDPSKEFWDKGVENNFYGLKGEVSQFQEQAGSRLNNAEVELAAMKLERDVDRLYETKGKDFGFESKQDFQEFLGKELEKVDPKWANAYFQHKEKALDAYFKMIEATHYNNAESPIAKAQRQKIEQEVMKKLSVKLGKNLSNIDLETGRPKSNNPYSSGVI